MDGFVRAISLHEFTLIVVLGGSGNSARSGRDGHGTEMVMGPFLGRVVRQRSGRGYESAYGGSFRPRSGSVRLRVAWGSVSNFLFSIYVFYLITSSHIASFQYAG